MRATLITAAALVALGASACGSTNSSDTIAQTPSLSTTATATVISPPAVTTITVAPTTSTAVSAPTTQAGTATDAQTVTTATITAPDSGGAGLATNTTTAGTPACVAADLTPAALPPNSAPGTTVLGITLKNVGSGSCHTYGWPGIAFVTATGKVVSTLTTRSVHDVLGSTPPTAFVLAPGDEASFRVTVHDAGGGTQASCGEYARLQIIAPDDTAAMQVSVPDGPVQSCANVAVSAIEPGTSATGQ